MEPHAGGPRSRKDNVLAWWNSLDERDLSHLRYTPVLPVALVLAAIVTAASMPLVWHHVITPKFIYYGVPVTHLVYGIDAQSWLLVLAAAAAVLAGWMMVRPPSLTMRWATTVLAFVFVNAMFFDYFDWSDRASGGVAPYFGPGYYLGLGAAALMVAAAVLSWRTSD